MVTVKLIELPLQLFENAVTVILETMGTVKLLVAENISIFPTPLALIPVAALSLIHLYSVPETADPLKMIGLICSFPHMVMSATGFTDGVGLTLMLNENGVPLQPFVKGVTVTVLFMGILEIFCAVNEDILPDPLVAINPIELLV